MQQAKFGTMSLSSAFLPATAAFLLAATAAPAQGIGSKAFTAACEVKSSKSTCACVAGKMQGTEPGRIIVEAFAIDQMTGNQRDDATFALLNRYNLRASDIDPINTQGKQLMQSYVNSCR